MYSIFKKKEKNMRRMAIEKEEDELAKLRSFTEGQREEIDHLKEIVLSLSLKC